MSKATVEEFGYRAVSLVVLRPAGRPPIPLHHLGVGQDVEQAIPDLARAGNAGLIITSGAGTFRNRDLIVRLAAEQNSRAISGRCDERHIILALALLAEVAAGPARPDSAEEVRAGEGRAGGLGELQRAQRRA